MPQAGSQNTSAVDKALASTVDAFGRAQQAIEAIAVATAHTIGRTATRLASPESAQVEFGISVSAKGDVILAGAAAEASFKVTLTDSAHAHQPIPAQPNAASAIGGTTA